jgi:3-oxoacyl-[acyl-carrier-protein] synthase-3
VNDLQGHFQLAGSAIALPETRLRNEDLASEIGLSPEDIRQRTGILERRVAGAGETASALGARAAREALARAGIPPAAVDVVLLSTYTPDHHLCPTAPRLAWEIGAERSGAFDINGACSGGVTALLTGCGLLAGGLFQTVLVVSADLTSLYIRRDDAKTRMLFGDGAAALVLQRPGADAPAPWRILSATMGADGRGADLFHVPEGGSARPLLNGTAAWGLPSIEMNGRAVFRFAVERGTAMVEHLCRDAGLAPEEIDHVVPHQANLRIINAMAERTAVPRERWAVNLERYGNTASASVPIALTELLASGRLRAGQSVLLVSFGAGLTWSGVALRAGG